MIIRDQINAALKKLYYETDCSMPASALYLDYRDYVEIAEDLLINFGWARMACKDGIEHAEERLKIFAVGDLPTGTVKVLYPDGTTAYTQFADEDASITGAVGVDW